MNPRRLLIIAAACQTVVIPACVAVWLVAAAFGSAGNENTGVARITERAGPLLAANAEFSGEQQQVVNDRPPLMTIDNADAAAVEAVTVPTTDAISSSREPETSSVRDPKPVVTATLRDSAQTVSPETTASQAAALNMPAPSPREIQQTSDSIQVLDECFAMDACIDRYLWALYQRTPKEDSIKEQEREKVTVKRKGKRVTVTRTFTKLVDEDFAWKDPKAAQKAGMSMMDYVIGGMDRGFKRRLFHTLLAAEAAGLSPGITSAFRDDYRQSLASGLKAANDRSYHGGSFRGGYGHGLAADIVSVNGATRAQRWTSTEILWKWIDAQGKEFGIGRPYLDRDPPHVAPIDGQEYADHNHGPKMRQSRAPQSGHRQSGANSKKPSRLTAQADHVTIKRHGMARSSKLKTT